MNFILIAVIVLGAIGLIAAIVLFAASKKFAVYEDPRIAQVGEVLPGANCGGCGFPGCSGMADALVKGADAGSIDGLSCPVGGAEVMGKVADLLGMAIANSEPMVAVVRCNGTCEHRAKIAEYAGLRTCAAMHACGAGETACGFGCLGCGDCEAAATIDENTRYITSLVNKMIALADEDVTDIRVNLHQVNCIEACHQAIVAMPPVNAAQVKVELHTLVSDDFCIKTNIECLQRMLSCLLENAVKFTEKGKIMLTVKQDEPDEETVHFIVEDTGCGISKKAQPHIFDRFAKADEFKKGLGLGLAYSYETAQKLGGKLEYDPTYTNGSRFILTLPLSC